MKRANQYKQTILDNFYLDDEGQVRRSHFAYHEAKSANAMVELLNNALERQS